MRNLTLTILIAIAFRDKARNYLRVHQEQEHRNKSGCNTRSLLLRSRIYNNNIHATVSNPLSNSCFICRFLLQIPTSRLGSTSSSTFTHFSEDGGLWGYPHSLISKKKRRNHWTNYHYTHGLEKLTILSVALVSDTTIRWHKAGKWNPRRLSIHCTMCTAG